VGKRQALGWLGATLCSIALIVAGGLVLSSVAVNRYLQASSSAMHRGDAAGTGATPQASELASVERAVSAITSMPGVATATSAIDAPTAMPHPTVDPSSPAPSATHAFSYDVSVIMNPDSTADQCADVVFSLTRQLQNGRVNLQLSAPAGDGHAASVIDYRHAFDTPVARSTVQSVSRAVAVAAAVPGVKSVHVMVPYTWNLSSGDLDVDFDSNDAHHSNELKNALSRTALSGVDWTPSQQ
jgi:hypothetical protein